MFSLFQINYKNIFNSVFNKLIDSLFTPTPYKCIDQLILDSKAIDWTYGLNGDDIDFEAKLIDDINAFKLRQSDDSVLVFPPLLPKYRYLFHELTRKHFGQTLATISIGTEGNRRPLLYHKSVIGCKQMDSNDNNIVNNVVKSGATSGAKHSNCGKKGKRLHKSNDRSHRRPDMKLYVPPKAKTDSNCCQTHAMDNTLQCDDQLIQHMCQTVNSLSRLQMTDSSHEKSNNYCQQNQTDSSTADCMQNSHSIDTKNGCIDMNEDIALKATNEESGDEPSWDAMFDENGECIQHDFVDKVNDLISDRKVDLKLEKSRIDYLNFQYNEPEVDGSDLAHILEVYDFPTELKTQDIMTSISVFNCRDFDIKWVDDTHALVVFSNSSAATEALKYVYPNVKLRPLSQAIRDSKLKARNCSEFLQPFKQRPQTSASLARRLVTQSLGLRDRISPEQRAAERKKLADAKEKKRLSAKQGLDVWEGNVS